LHPLSTLFPYTTLFRSIRRADHAQINNIVHSGELEVLMATYPDRSWATQYAPPPRVIVERKEAQIAAWYEFFPRSAEGRGDRGSDRKSTRLNSSHVSIS